MSNKRQALFVYIPKGHHLSHVKMLHEMGLLVDLITTKDFIDKLDVDLTDLSVKVHCIEDFLESPSSAYQKLRAFLVENPGYDEVITTSLDEMWKPLLWRFVLGRPPLPNEVALSGIWVGANFIYRKCRDLKRIVCMRVVQKICRGLVSADGRVLFFNETLRETMISKLRNMQAHLLVCPDPYQGAILPAANGCRGSREDPPMLLMAGYHTARKGTLWALQSLAGWSGPRIRIVIAGVCEDVVSIQNAIKELPATVEVECLNRWVSDDELSAYYRSASAVLLPYRKFGGSSGVFVNALAHRCPVVVPDWGVIAQRTRKYNLGLIFEHDSRESFLSAISGLLESSFTVAACDGVDTYLDENSPEAYANCLMG